MKLLWELTFRDCDCGSGLTSGTYGRSDKSTKTVNNMSISRVYRMIPAIAGKLPIDEVFEIIKYEWVKEVWLDERLYVMKS